MMKIKLVLNVYLNIFTIEECAKFTIHHVEYLLIYCSLTALIKSYDCWIINASPYYGTPRTGDLTPCDGIITIIYSSIISVSTGNENNMLENKPMNQV